MNFGEIREGAKVLGLPSTSWSCLSFAWGLTSSQELAVGHLPQDTGLGSIQELVPLVITRETEKFPDYKRNNWCVGQRKNNPHFPLQKVCKVQNIKTSFLNKINLQMYRFHRAQTWQSFRNWHQHITHFPNLFPFLTNSRRFICWFFVKLAKPRAASHSVGRQLALKILIHDDGDLELTHFVL